MTEQTVTFTEALHLNQPVTGTFQLVQDYTEWGGTTAIGEPVRRRVGTSGPGFIKVYGVDFRGHARVFKVTVQGRGVGYTINNAVNPEVLELLAEIAEYQDAKEDATTSAERSKFSKRIKRREAKIEAIQALEA